MRKKEDTASIQNEAQSLIELGRLLKRKRSAEKQAQIEKIIHSKRHTDEKIAEIHRLDEEAVQENKPREEQKINRFGSREKTENKIIKRKLIIRNRHSVKQLPSYNGFFQYLFSDFRKIKEFGVRHRLLTSSIIPGKLKINRNAGVLLTKSLKPTSRELLPLLNRCIDEGWKFLTKTNYNLIVLMKELTEKVSSASFNSYRQARSRNLLDRFMELENLFICLYYRDDYPRRVIDSLEDVIGNLSEGMAKAEEGGMQVRRILFPDITLPSLTNFLLILNMIKFRKFITVKDLINTKAGKVVDSTRFDCSRSIQAKINSMINDIKHEVLLLYRKEREVKELKSFVPMGSDKMLDFTPLKRIYEGGGGTDHHFEQDKDKILHFVPRFNYAFTAVFGNLLAGKINTENIGLVRIFKEVFFNRELDRLIRTAEKIEQLAFKSPVFPKKRYIQVRKDRSEAITVEVEILQLIDECILIYRELMEKLAEIIRRDKSDTDRQLSTPVDPVYLEKDNFSIPFAYSIILDNPVCSGKTVRHSISGIVSVLLLYLLHLDDSYTKNMVNRDQEIRRDINTKLEVLERLCEPEEYAEFREQITF
ncbi:MAG: hypothetical protein ACLFST_02050 [Spirochaetia bacterium]